ncbi:hypothetical protein HBI27_174560 [Parastagonospora nodorum]|nr:hypothetical protein HBI27_174560 [Parastagonospora nodorum]KAH6384501.1 hypothetical protein HBI14_214390 [Parastagonospora nodorum]
MSLLPDSSITPHAQQVDTSSASSLPFSSSTSPLFALPKHGISLLPGNRDRPPHFSARGPNVWIQPAEEDSPKGGFNQLRFTCHQLYHETAGTEIKFNEIYIYGEPEAAGPAQLFSEFLTCCANKKDAWFQDVALCLNDGIDGVWIEQKDHMIPIAMLCRSQGHTNVRYMLRALDIRDGGLGWILKVGLYLELAFREKDLRSSVIKDSELDSLVDEMEDAAGLDWFSDPERLTLGSLPNFRFLPFDARSWPTHIDDVELKTLISPWTDVLDEDFCIPLLKRWTNEGI